MLPRLQVAKMLQGMNKTLSNPAADLSSRVSSCYSTDHSLPINVDAMNSEFVARSQEVWDAVERDRWLYDLDKDEGFVPNFKKKGEKTTEKEGDEAS